jgi:hypothetical protein
MQDLRELLTEDVMKPIMGVMNSPLGFLTDSTGKPRFDGDTKWKALYKWDVVRDCTIEATLRGLAMVGNEVNIIAGRCYAAKNGLRRRVTQFPGLSDLQEFYDIPRTTDKGAIVKAKATWILSGTVMEISREFAVKGDGFATADSYTGKATRKLLNAILEKISGITLPDGDATEMPLTHEKPVSSSRPAINSIDVSAEELPANDEVKMEETPEPEKPANANPNEWLNVVVVGVDEKKGKKNGEDVVAFLVKLADGRKCFTHDSAVATEAKVSIGKPAGINVRDGDKGSKIITAFILMEELA